MNCNNKMGLGFMRFPPDITIFDEFLKEAFKLNVTYIESCQFYIKNQCEQLLGEALSKYPRDKYQLAAKFSYNGLAIKPNVSQFNQIFENQLKTLKVSYFDYYLLQAVDRRSLMDDLQPQTWFKDYYQFLQEKKREGKIKNIGFSFHDTPPYLESLFKNFQWDFCQLQLNYYDWYVGYAKPLYYLTEQYNIPVFVMGGLKGGKLTNQQQIPPDLAYNFLNMLPNVKIILNGSPNINFLKENNYLINNPKPLKKYELEIIKKIAYSDETIQCTSCKYCENVCPKGFKIYEIFENYNEAILNRTSQQYLEKIKSNNNYILQCIGCKKCEQVCPQHLPISNYMKTKIFQLRL